MKAIQIMAAMAQPTRLAVYQLLVAALPGGMTASAIADAVGMSRTAMSPHFAILSAAGLLASDKAGRTVTYRAEKAPIEGLGGFLAGAIEAGSRG